MERQQDPDPPDNRYLHVDKFNFNATDSFMCKQDEITEEQFSKQSSATTKHNYHGNMIRSK